MAELPGYAAFLLKNHVEEIAKYALRLSRELNVPLMKLFSNVSDEDLLKLMVPGYTELFQSFIDGTTHKVIAKTVESWKNNQLPIIEREQIVAEDIPLAMQVRKQMLLHFLPQYTNDLAKALQIVKEIDEHQRYHVTELFRAYTNILQSRIEKHLEEFRQSDQLFRQAQAVTKIGNYVWDLRKKTIIWSDELYRIYEIDRQSPISNEILRAFNHPEDNIIVDESIGSSMRSGKPFNFYYRIVFKDQREKVLHARGEIEYDSAGNAIKIFGTAQDVTEQKGVEARLEEHQRILLQKTTELQQSNQSLEEFAFIASHDLKEPLRKISTLTDRLVMIENANLSEDGKIYLQKVVSSSIRMQQMVDDLLSLAQVTSDRSYQKVSLQTLLGEVLQTFDQKIEETNSKIVSKGLPDAVVVPSQFRQLFQNLISNSLKFRRPEVTTVVEITHEYLTAQAATQYGLSPSGRYLKLTFSDNGIGFDNRFLPKIFSIFQRLHPRHKYEGTGIGLSIVKKIVENHNGVIFANGIVNEGATFTVIVPDNN